MDWSVILDYVLKIVGSMAATLVVTLASILFTMLRSKIKDSKIMNYVKEAVKAAEQLYPNQGTKMGPDKYKYVVEMVIKKFPTLTDNEYLKSLIEGAVFALNKQLGVEVEAKEELPEDKQNKTITNSLTSF